MGVTPMTPSRSCATRPLLRTTSSSTWLQGTFWSFSVTLPRTWSAMTMFFLPTSAISRSAFLMSASIRSIVIFSAFFDERGTPAAPVKSKGTVMPTSPPMCSGKRQARMVRAKHSASMVSFVFTVTSCTLPFGATDQSATATPA